MHGISDHYKEFCSGEENVLSGPPCLASAIEYDVNGAHRLNFGFQIYCFASRRAREARMSSFSQDNGACYTP